MSKIKFYFLPTLVLLLTLKNRLDLMSSSFSSVSQPVAFSSARYGDGFDERFMEFFSLVTNQFVNTYLISTLINLLL